MTKNTSPEILEALRDLKSEGESELKQLDTILSRFNPFEVLRLQRMEIRHSNVLAWLLDSRGSHGLGARFAIAWFELIGRDSAEQTHQLADLIKNARGRLTLKSQREWRGEGGNGRAADILVKVRPGSEKTIAVICIENKIRHEQSKDQLKDYWEMVERNFSDVENKFYFLLSSNREAPKDPSFHPICYSSVAECLETILQAADQQPVSLDVRDFLNHYHTILRRYLMNDSEEMKLALKINREHRKALDYIISVRPDERTDLTRMVAERFATETNLLQVVTLQIDDNKGIIRFIPMGWNTSSNRSPEGQDWRQVFCQIGMYEKANHPTIVGTTWAGGRSELAPPLATALNSAIRNHPFQNAIIHNFEDEWYEFFEVSGNSIPISDLPNEKLELLADEVFRWAKAIIQSEEFLKMADLVEEILTKRC